VIAFTCMMKLLQFFLFPFVLFTKFTTRIDAASNGSDDVTETKLLDGSVVTRSPVKDQANLAYDVREMVELLDSGNHAEAQEIYTLGKYSLQFDQYGNEIPQKRTLASLSQNALAGKFKNEMTYSFHLFGLSGKKSSKLNDHSTYAHDFVMEVLADPNSGRIAAEAAVALNLWMYVVHEMWDAVQDCLNAVEADQTESYLALTNNQGKGVYAIDEAIAYYIGSDQQGGSGNGFSLYTLVQDAGDLFGKNSPEAEVNAAIKEFYFEARTAMSFNDACTTRSNTVENLYSITIKMVQKMYIPLVQMLIHSLRAEDGVRTQMYAYAIIPQISQCKSDTFQSLKALLLDREEYFKADFEKIIGLLQESYPCLGITCADIGAYRTDEVAQCADPPGKLPLAGYSPTSNVVEESRIDLDILQIRSLLLMNKVSAADMIYRWGKNSQSSIGSNGPFLSLQYLATTSMRSRVDPFYDQYVSYHDSEVYADAMIRSAMEGAGKWKSVTTGQLSEFVSKTLQYQVMFIIALAYLNEAYDEICDENNDKKDIDAASHSWDIGAAFLIGSLEGHTEGGDMNNGLLHWNLVNNMADKYDTLNSNGYAKANSQLEDLLYAGKGELRAYDCEDVEDIGRKMATIIIMPIVQAVIAYALQLEGQGIGSSSADLAGGEAIATAILPILAYYEPQTAEVLVRNMIMDKDTKPVIDGSQAVANALYPLIDQFGIECKDMGDISGVNACSSSNTGSTSNADIVGRSGILAFLLIPLVFSISHIMQ